MTETAPKKPSSAVADSIPTRPTGAPSLPVVRPDPQPPDAPRLFYKHGRRYPRAIAWFGARSFWGHLWHLAASVIATEDIDSRDWMRADPPDEFTRRLADILVHDRRLEADVGSLTEALDRDLWIDFHADTGDDASVSAAVAKLLFERYELPDPEDPEKTLLAPRGDLLVFGGDTAYPVATELEIHNRVIVPYNRVLRERARSEPAAGLRVLLGIPGNHDWYAGLDGFHRMFSERRGRVSRESRLPKDEIDRMGQVGHLVSWIEAFRVGRFVAKRPALPLEGYVPVQTASYFALRLAPGLDFWGVDRQLRSVDFQQQLYFAEARRDCGVVLCMADPAYAFLEPNAPGQQILRSLDMTLEEDGVFVLVGDTHHYCRQEFPPGLHVTAGGGGAFLHPQRILRGDLPAPAAEFPGPRTTLALALSVPWAIAHGRSGFLVHIGVAVALLPMFGFVVAGARYLVPAITTSAVLFVVCFLIGGWRVRRAWLVGLLALAAGTAVGLSPVVVHGAAQLAARALDLALSDRWLATLAFAASIYVGALVFGTYLMMLTLLGLEQHQAFSALAHPGYKHFVRLRVRRDGSAIDGWVIGKVDPLRPQEPVVLVDRFTWTNPQQSSRAEVEGGPGTSGDA